MKFRLASLVAFGACILAGCSGLSVDTADSPRGDAIMFSAGDGLETKAGAETAIPSSGFRVSCEKNDGTAFFDNYTASLSSGVYGLSTTRYFPGDKTLDFYAASPVSGTTWSTSAKSFSWTLGSSCSDDLVVATTRGASSSPVGLQFKHLLTRINSVTFVFPEGFADWVVSDLSPVYDMYFALGVNCRQSLTYTYKTTSTTESVVYSGTDAWHYFEEQYEYDEADGMFQYLWAFNDEWPLDTQSFYVIPASASGGTGVIYIYPQVCIENDEYCWDMADDFEIEVAPGESYDIIVEVNVLGNMVVRAEVSSWSSTSYTYTETI